MGWGVRQAVGAPRPGNDEVLVALDDQRSLQEK